MWSHETLPVGRAHETRLEGAPDLDSKVREGGAEGRCGDSCARSDPRDGDGARDNDSMGEGSERPHSRVGELSAARRSEHDRAVVERDQFANTPSGVWGFKGSVLGASSLGERVPSRQHRELDG